MPGHPLLNEANRLLARWPAPDTGQAVLRSELIRHVAAHTDSVFRSCGDGHLTASAIVLDATRRLVLLTLHPRLGRWIQMGGHIEPDDASVEAAALREATEESGIAGLVLDPVPVCSDESLDVAWFPVTALPAELDASTVRLIARALARGR